MSQVPIWFEREFEFSFPVELYPNLTARSRGTPARLEEALRGRSHKVLIRKVQEKWSAQEHAGYLFDLETKNEVVESFHCSHLLGGLRRRAAVRCFSRNVQSYVQVALGSSSTFLLRCCAPGSAWRRQGGPHREVAQEAELVPARFVARPERCALPFPFGLSSFSSAYLIVSLLL
jgi:hypothetical protein